MKDDLIRRKDAIDKMVYSADIIALRELPSAQDADCISRQDAIDVHCEYCPDKYICCPVANGNSCPEMEVFLSLLSKQPTYTEEEIQKMQTLEQAEIEKAYQLGYEEGKKDAQSERKTARWIDGQCSNCGCDIPAYIIDWKWQKDMDAKFCPNCGYRMVRAID